MLNKRGRGAVDHIATMATIRCDQLVYDHTL